MPVEQSISGIVVTEVILFAMLPNYNAPVLHQLAVARAQRAAIPRMDTATVLEFVLVIIQILAEHANRQHQFLGLATKLPAA